MTDPWAEKPTPFEEERYPHGIMRNPVYYQVSEMDAWLEKLKVEYDKLKEKAEKWDKLETSELLHDIIVNASKLEAVKKLVEQDLPQIIMTHYFRRRFYQVTGFPVPDWFKKAMDAEDEQPDADELELRKYEDGQRQDEAEDEAAEAPQ